MGVAGNVAPLWCGCTVAGLRDCGLLNTKTKCIRHCDSLTLKHMANINDREYQSYNRLRVVWSRCLLYFSLKLGCPVTSHFFTVLMLNQAHLSSKAHFLQQSSVNIFSINEYFRFMRVSVHDIFKAKTIFVCHDWQRQHFIFLILRTREGHMSIITKLRLSSSEETLFKQA